MSQGNRYARVKVLALLAAALLVVPAFGCGGGAQSVSKPSASPSTQASASPSPSASASPSPSQSAQPQVKTRGVSKDSVKIGWIGGVTGPTASIGQAIKAGAESYFKKVNDAGGVNGRKIEFVAENDEYDPAKGVAAFKKLVERDEVFAIASMFGAASINAVMPLAEQSKVPLISPTTSDWVLAHPPKKYVFATLVPYRYQVAVSLDYALTKLGAKKVGVLYQNDEYGQEQVDVVESRLKNDARAKLVSKQAYERTATDVSSQVLALKQSEADTVFLFAAVKPASMAVMEAQKLAWTPQFIGNSGVADIQLIKLSGNAAENMIVSYGTEMPGISSGKGVEELTTDLKKYAPDVTPSYYAVVGYIGAKLTAEGLKRTADPITVDSFIAAMESMKDYNIGLTPPLSYGPTLREGTKQVALAQVKGDKFVELQPWQTAKE